GSGGPARRDTGARRPSERLRGQLQDAVEAEVSHPLGKELGWRVVRVVQDRAPHEADQHRGPKVLVHLAEDAGLGPALEHAGELAGDAIAARPHNLLLPEEQPRLALLHESEEWEVAGEGLHDGADHP